MHRRRLFPCGQALHTLHFDRGFTPCSHGPFGGGPLFRFVPWFAPSPSSASTSAFTSPRPPSRRRSRAACRGRAPIPSSSPTHRPRAPRSADTETCLLFMIGNERPEIKDRGGRGHTATAHSWSARNVDARESEMAATAMTATISSRVASPGARASTAHLGTSGRRRAVEPNQQLHRRA